MIIIRRRRREENRKLHPALFAQSDVKSASRNKLTEIQNSTLRVRKSLSQETLYFVYTSSRLRKILLCGFNIIRDVVFDVRKIFSFAENNGRFIILRDFVLGIAISRLRKNIFCYREWWLIYYLKRFYTSIGVH